MNIFKISKNISLNIFSFLGFFNIIWQIFFIKQIFETFTIFQTDASAINGLIFLPSLNIFITVLIFVLFGTVSFIEYLVNTDAKYKINNEYKNNKFAMIYFYCGILGNFLPIIISILVLNFS